VSSLDPSHTIPSTPTTIPSAFSSPAATQQGQQVGGSQVGDTQQLLELQTNKVISWTDYMPGVDLNLVY